ncbi:MAG: nitroreductase [Pseudomonadota bacterium]
MSDIAPSDAATLGVLEAIRGRKSVRRFLSDPVEQETIRRILSDAARAASGTNSQPWKVYVATGAARERVCDAVIAAAKAGETTQEYAYAPERWWEPFQSRRRKVGYDLYALMGIARDDKAGRFAQVLRNFELFGAPVGLFFTMDKRWVYGSWIDLGLYMQSVMLAARGYGLETCPQAAWLHHGRQVHDALAIPDDEVLISGMALGYADWSAKENSLRTERADVDEFTTFLDT